MSLTVAMDLSVWATWGCHERNFISNSFICF